MQILCYWSPMQIWIPLHPCSLSGGQCCLSARVQVYFCLVRARVARSWWPGPGGPVPVARSRCPAPVFAVARWPGPGPGQVLAVYPVVLVARWPGPGPGSCLGPGPLCWRWPGPGPGPPGPGGRVAVPIKRITYAVWPASMSPGMDAQSLPGIWLFYAVLQTTGERQTILRSRNHYRIKTGAKRLPKPTA